MFNYISGKVAEIYDNVAVIDVGGVGYELIASRFCIGALRVGANAKLYAHLSVKEDGVTLIGFYSKEEKAMFLRLISISGIGPKVAIGILSGLSLNDLTAAIVSCDYKMLGGIKGIGKKTAERIVLELKDKLGEEFASSDIGGGDATANEDAVMALMALGYTKQEAVNSVKKIDTQGKSVEDIIKAALKRG